MLLSMQMQYMRVRAAMDHPEHRHYFRPDLADMWCEQCETVTDYCQQINPW